MIVSEPLLITITCMCSLLHASLQRAEPPSVLATSSLISECCVHCFFSSLYAAQTHSRIRCFTAACATTAGVGHKLGPRGAYATRDGAALDIEECCQECSADCRCRTFTFFEHTCYMYEGGQGNDDGDRIGCPGCVFGVASGTGSLKVCIRHYVSYHDVCRITTGFNTH